MKIYLALISAVALALSACGSQDSAPAGDAAASAAPASGTSAPAAESASPAAAADKVDPASVSAECTFTVEANDQMKYNVSEIPVKKSCEAFKVVLKHTGSMPVAQMGHNIVITKADDASSVASEGTAAGPDAGYLNAENPAVVAHTDMIGGGQETVLAFKTSRLDPAGSYKFFCTFPSHFGMMQGDVKLVD